MTILWAPKFYAGSSLVTNEYHHWNPLASDSVFSPEWDMTSGSLATRLDDFPGAPVDGMGYSMKVDSDGCSPSSSPNTNSAIFRLNSRCFSYANARVDMGLKVQQIASTPSTPEVAWDGVHIFLRYQSQFALYYASVARRDGRVVIKKKVPGGPSNNGTYYSLSPEVQGFTVPINEWRTVGASAKTLSSGDVEIKAYINGSMVASAVDTGVGGPAYGPGAVGIRGDNTRFNFRQFAVSSL